MRIRGLALLALLLAAGCVTPASDVAPASATGLDVATVMERFSPILGDLAIMHEVLDVDTAHGVVNVDLYKPQVPEGVRMPVILVASPYNNANSPLGGGKNGDNESWVDLPLYNWIRRELMPRGYAFAQMDILGTRNSGGCMGIMNKAEREATATVVDWLGEQEWTNGKVGMIGKSYLGLSQLGAAVENPEHLVTIVPISPPTHDYAYHYYNGVPYALNHATNVLYYGAYSLPPPDGDLATYAPRAAEHVPCAPEAIAGGAYTLGDYSARWQERDYRPLLPAMRDDIAVFFVHGHQDWNVKPDHVLDVYDAIPGPKTLLIGQWAHDYPNINNYDEDAYGEREDWYYMLHRWFDHWLLDVDTGLMQEIAGCPVQTQGSDAQWRCLADWPPLPKRFDDAASDAAEVQWLALYPTIDGLKDEPPALDAATAGYVDLPEHGVEDLTTLDVPVPDFTTSIPFPDARTVDAYRVAGAPEILMRVSTTSANTYLVAALAVEDASGAQKEVTWAFQSLRHRNDLAAPEPVVPGTFYDVRFRFYPLDLIVHEGERLVLTLRGSSGAPNGGILPNPTPGNVVVDLLETSLHLPLAAIDGAFVPLANADLPPSHHQED